MIWLPFLPSTPLVRLHLNISHLWPPFSLLLPWQFKPYLLISLRALMLFLIKRWSLFPYLSNLCDLLWPTEWGGSNSVPAEDGLQEKSFSVGSLGHRLSRYVNKLELACCRWAIPNETIPDQPALQSLGNWAQRSVWVQLKLELPTWVQPIADPQKYKINKRWLF